VYLFGRVGLSDRKENENCPQRWGFWPKMAQNRPKSPFFHIHRALTENLKCIMLFRKLKRLLRMHTVAGNKSHPGEKRQLRPADASWGCSPTTKIAVCKHTNKGSPRKYKIHHAGLQAAKASTDPRRVRRPVTSREKWQLRPADACMGVFTIDFFFFFFRGPYTLRSVHCRGNQAM
jgi:hypothetical protein